MPLKPYARPSGVYHIRGTHCGVRVDRSSGARDLTAARLVAAKWEAEIFERWIKGPKAVATFAEAAAGYLRGGGSRTGLTRLIHRFGLTRLADIGQSDLDAFAVQALPNGAPSYRRRHVYTPFVAVWNWAVDAQLAEPRAWRKPAEPKGRTDWRTPAEIEKLLAECGPNLRRIVTFYVGTGARASEAIGLEWQDVSPAAHKAALWETKGGYARSLPLCDRVRFALPQRGEGVVFRNEAGAPWHAYDAVNLGLKRAAKRAKLRPLSCHVLRHTWATWRHALSPNLVELMTYGGWKSADMVMRYAHLGSDDLAAEVLAHGWELLGKRDDTPRKTATGA